MATAPTRIADTPVDPIFVNRWSPRSFTDASITLAELTGILEAARWAPSASNVQPWRFVYSLRNDAAWADLAATLAPGNQTWAPKAAALIAVTSHKLMVPPGGSELVNNGAHAFDAGAAWAFLALQASQSGWATHAMGGFNAEAAATVIKLPADYAIHCIVAIGRQGDAEALPDALKSREQPSQRRPIADSMIPGAF